MSSSSFDVAIVGGGPGGSATALSLRRHAPSLSVVLIEASCYDEVRIGETLPPPARPILEHLGVWEIFRAQGHREVRGTTAVWGADLPLDNDFIFMPANTGWHLDRTAFDALLAGQAKNQGTELLLGTRLRDAERAGDQWRLTLSTDSTLSARFVVDATGGIAAFARRCGAHFVDSDRLVGFARFFEGGSDDPRIMVEAFEEGWWYTAGLPDGRRVAGCVTDADLARHMRLRDEAQWCRMLGRMYNIGGMVRGSKACSPVFVRATESRRLEPAAGDHWLAVGDSASRFDPLSSQGIVKALRSGVFASYAIGDLLTQNDDSGMCRYRRYVREEFKSYAEARAKYYGEEQRWPASEFWRRRHAETRSVIRDA
jgi:flavin-dependent dehydrogenase